MAWNESFSVAEGGGWAGDASFATAPPKEAQSIKVAERLPVPVTISALHDSANAEEKYELGDFPFSTVLTMGIVKSVSEQENTTNHVLGDPEDMDKEFEVADADTGLNTFVEGTKLMVVGKLRSLSDRHGIMSYGIREVIDEKEYMAFRLEAKIAKHYFEKNVPSILRSGMGEVIVGCAAGAPADSTAAAGPAEIIDVLHRERDNYEATGMSESDIKRAIGATSMESLQKDLQFLINEGHIYNTTDDEHYALID
ncbi:unnamed protein product [Heligmosomoides polygyrus]|uniref:RPA_C domain-containing protein n=1 Tax=Heligmosomoides polygyrus TaxID=6339 RepID=A0A183GF26_HELPZ|nr:unnamed protein product [Heligmosomoides polygyrus]